MKGTFFNRPLEWNIETKEESWQQGAKINGVLKVKNHGAEKMSLGESGVGLAFAEIKKVHAKTAGALKFSSKVSFPETELAADQTLELPFSITIEPNAPVSDKKGTLFLAYGRGFEENHLQLSIHPRALFGKIIGLLDTFERFKIKEFKSVKTGVEYKLIPPTSREMANIDSLLLTMSMSGDQLELGFNFQVKKLDTSSITTKISKSSLELKRSLSPKHYSLGFEMINQDELLKELGSVIAEVKLKSVF